MDIIETIQRGDYHVNIVHDPFPVNPREFDNLGYMVCWHQRYQLGDEMPKIDMRDWLDELSEQYAIVLPIYLLDHSSLTLSTESFNDPWDSGQVGWICVTQEQLDAEYGLNYNDAYLRSILRDEVTTYSAYLNGQCYGWQITLDDGELVDDGYGFYNIDQCISEANSVVDDMLRWK